MKDEADTATDATPDPAPVAAANDDAAEARRADAPVRMKDLFDVEQAIGERLARIESRQDERSEADELDQDDELVAEEGDASPSPARVSGGVAVAVIVGLVLLVTYFLNAKRTTP